MKKLKFLLLALFLFSCSSEKVISYKDLEKKKIKGTLYSFRGNTYFGTFFLVPRKNNSKVKNLFRIPSKDLIFLDLVLGPEQKTVLGKPIQKKECLQKTMECFFLPLTLKKSLIKKVLDRENGRFKKCYSKFLNSKKRRIEGYGRLEFYIGKNGKVKRPKVVSVSQKIPNGLRKCLRKEIKLIKFPSSREELSVLRPLKFHKQRRMKGKG